MRPKKTNKMIRASVQLPPGIVADMREFCSSVGMPVSSFIRRAIREYLISLKLDDLGRYTNGK